MLLQAFYEESKTKWSYHKILISLIYFVFIILGFIALLLCQQKESVKHLESVHFLIRTKIVVTEGKFCSITVHFSNSKRIVFKEETKWNNS